MDNEQQAALERQQAEHELRLHALNAREERLIQREISLSERESSLGDYQRFIRHRDNTKHSLILNYIFCLLGIGLAIWEVAITANDKGAHCNENLPKFAWGLLSAAGCKFVEGCVIAGFEIEYTQNSATQRPWIFWTAGVLRNFIGCLSLIVGACMTLVLSSMCAPGSDTT